MLNLNNTNSYIQLHSENLGSTSRYEYAAKHIANQEYEHHSISDSGTTVHYLLITSPVVNKVKVNEGIQVVLSDKKIITSTHDAYLNIPQLPNTTKKAHIFPVLSHDTLISISQLCDKDYIAVLNKQEMIIVKDGKIYIIGHSTLAVYPGSFTNITKISTSCPFYHKHGINTSRNFILELVNDEKCAASPHMQNMHVYTVSKWHSPNTRQRSLDRKSSKRIGKIG